MLIQRLKALFFNQNLTFGQLTESYKASRDFAALAASSQCVYARVLTHLAGSFGAETPLARIDRARIERHLRLRTAGAAGDDLKKLRILTRHAIERGWLDRDPTLGIRRAKPGRGHHTWTEPEIAQFEQRWPVGSRERRAFALLLYTGQRRSDVVRMRWADVHDDLLHVRQSKTGAQLCIPIHSALREALGKPGKGPILKTARGHAHTIAGFGVWFAARIEQAGLPSRCVTHGLRKAAARRLAEAGASIHEIAAITGHRSLKEIERYTRGASQERLARQAMRRVTQANRVFSKSEGHRDEAHNLGNPR